MATMVLTEIHTIRAHLKDMLEARGDDVTYIQEHGDAVEPARYYSELIVLDTDRTTVFFALSKKVLTEWKQQEESAEAMIERYKTKNFILLLSDAPWSPMMQYIDARDKALQTHGGMLQVFYKKELMYNPLHHELVPKHERLSEEEAKEVMDMYLIKHRAQMPLISRNDAIARRLGLRQGDIVRIIRNNETSGMYFYYRCCV
jgi:DNA-directed RNA polymerase subunit H (RpoH/RPB5)